VDAGVQMELTEGALPSTTDPLPEIEGPIAEIEAIAAGVPATAPISHPAVSGTEVTGRPASTGNGHRVPVPAPGGERLSAAAPISTVSQALSPMMGDAPLCDTCGHITVRNGSCYRCLNCGNSMGCS